MRSCLVTEPVIPVVVPGLGEEGPVVLPQHQTVLIVPVIGLAICPVKPLNSLVHVRPVPLSLVVVGVMTSLNKNMVIIMVNIISCFVITQTVTQIRHSMIVSYPTPLQI